MDVTPDRVGSPAPARTVDGGTRGRRRRPSGQPPPLPRNLGRSGRIWLLILAYFLVSLIGVFLFSPLQRLYEGFDAAVLRGVARVRSPLLNEIASVVDVLASRWTIRILRWGTILVLVAFRRWRQLLVFAGAVIALEIVSYQVSLFIGRPRPFDVWIIAPWNGFAMPSRPLASIAVTLVGMLYALVPHGRRRDVGKLIVGAVLVALAVARVELGVDHLSSATFGAVLGVAVALTAFRLFAPNEAFPVTYRRGKAAHLDVGGRRGAAIVEAVRDQLGLDVLDVRPVGLAGSGGSTPVRLTIADGGAQRYVFAKVYSMTHVRSDRWYKLGRQILYGALEDETPFASVRRFVEYEDYALRLLYDEKFPSPRPYGIVEITPEREYMIVMEFFDGAVEIGEATVDETVIDEGLVLVRKMWDLGVAHRDVKPANLMVQDGHLRLIDVFFVQVRPSPWRQAVDLANMMLTLALRSDAATVYERATRAFTPEDIAEAFAATRGVASPTQLRTMLKQDERDLLAEFRALAPQRKPIAIQRWSVRRVVVTVMVALVALIAMSLVASNWAVFA